MKYHMLIASVIVLCIPGCGPKARTQSSPDGDEFPVSQGPEKPTQPEKSTAQTPAAATGLVKPYFPQPISTEDEAQACLAAARELDERIKRLTGVPSHDVTKRLTDCIVRYDADKTGYTKFYPGKTRIRFNLRDRDIADVNVSVPEHEAAVLHVRIDATTMVISCTDVSTDQQAKVMLMRASDSEPFRRVGPWDRIERPDELEKYCVQLYDDFFKLRDQ